MRVGSRFSADGGTSIAEVLALQPPEPALLRIAMNAETVISNPIPGKFQVPAILEVRCVPAPDGCRLGGTLVDKNAILLLPQDRKSTRLNSSH